VVRQVPAALKRSGHVLAQAKPENCAGVSDHFGVNIDETKGAVGCVETAAEAEQRCWSPPHYSEKPRCWEMPSEIAEDTTLPS